MAMPRKGLSASLEYRLRRPINALISNHCAPSALTQTWLALRFVVACCLVISLLAIGRAHADSTDESLRVYAVHILQGPNQSPTGAGIYLGKGLVITAAHVTNSRQPGVSIAGLSLPASIIKKGEFEQIDLALLSVDEEKLPISLRLRRMPLCQQPPWVGESVIIAIPESTARSHIMSPLLLPPKFQMRFRTVISDVATTGNSGSGVFDAGRKCLLGVMSLRIFVFPKGDKTKEKDIAKYFVPASAIAAFVPGDYRF